MARGLNWFKTSRLGRALTIALTLEVLFILVSTLMLPAPRTLSFIDARVETLSYYVTNSDLARINARGYVFRQGQEPEVQSRCVELVPALRSRVSYTWLRGSGLVVEVAEPGPGMAIPDDATYALVDAGRCLCSNPDEKMSPGNCSEERPLRLPIRGPGTLGSLYGAAENSLLLLSGNLGVYGRSLLGGTLYPIFDDPLPLPAGSVLSTGEGDIPGESALVGFAEVRDEALDVWVTTEAREVALNPAGGSILPVRIAIDKFARLFEDPAIVLIQIYLLAFVFILQFVADVLEWNAGRRPRSSAFVDERGGSTAPDGENSPTTSDERGVEEPGESVS